MGIYKDYTVEVEIKLSDFDIEQIIEYLHGCRLSERERHEIIETCVSGQNRMMQPHRLMQINNLDELNKYEFLERVYSNNSLQEIEVEIESSNLKS